jgi:large subunit ribosomal protein L22
MNSVKAISRNVRMSPMKVREVARGLVGKPANEALSILRFIPRKSALLLAKTLKSAIANAENNHNLSSANLVVTEAHVDDAPVLKRFMPASRGSAKRIRKRSSHIRIVLSSADQQPAPKKAKKAAKSASQKEVK